MFMRMLIFDRIKVYAFENKPFALGCGMLVIPFRFVHVEFPVEVYNFLIQCPQNEICIVPGILRVRFPTPVQLR